MGGEAQEGWMGGEGQQEGWLAFPKTNPKSMWMRWPARDVDEVACMAHWRGSVWDCNMQWLIILLVRCPNRTCTEGNSAMAQ